MFAKIIPFELKSNPSNNIVFKIPVIRNRPDVYSTIVAVIQDEIKSGSSREDSRDGNVGKVEDDEEEEEEEEDEDCMRIIEETMVDPKSLPGRTYIDRVPYFHQ